MHLIFEPGQIETETYHLIMENSPYIILKPRGKLISKLDCNTTSICVRIDSAPFNNHRKQDAPQREIKGLFCSIRGHI